MNFIDLAVLAVFAFIILFGYYEGFLQSAISIAAFFLSWLGAALFTMPMSKTIRGFGNLYDMLLMYAEGAERLNSVENAKVSISQLYAQQLGDVLSQSTLPSPIDTVVAKNIASEAFANLNVVTLGDYVNHTIVNYCINIISFLIVFCILRLVFEFIIKGVDYVRPFPLLAHFDSLLGAGVSVIRAFFAVFVIFMIIPVILLLLPANGAFSSSFITNYITESFTGSFFYNSNFLLLLISGV